MSQPSVSTPLMERAFRECLAEAQDRDQTIFLSSHQLSEVNSVCDRVGILRRGVLVEVAGLADLRRLRRVESRAAVRLVRRGGSS